MKKMLSLFIVMVLILSMPFAAISAHAEQVRYLDRIKTINEQNAAKYAVSFINSLYPDYKLQSGNVLTFYGETDSISGYCVDLINGTAPNGYVVIKFANGEPVVSEYCIDENARNPYDNIIGNEKITSTELKFYSVTPNDYQVYDGEKETVYNSNGTTFSKTLFEQFKQQVKQEKLAIQKEVELNAKTRSVPVDNEIIVYSDSLLQVITDGYTGTITQSKLVLYSSSMTYLTRMNVPAGSTYNCSVVAIWNLMRFYRTYKGFTRIDSNDASLYSTMYQYAGTTSQGTVNGNEVVAIKNYLNSLNYSCSYNNFWYDWYSDFKTALNSDKPCILTYGFTVNGADQGHAVLVMGYTQTSTYQYLRVADGLNSGLRYLNFNGYNYSRLDGWSITAS